MSRNNWLWLLGILLLATALRFYRVADMPLRADEATNLFIAADSPEAIIHTFASDDPHMPLYYLLLHYWMQWAGRSELAARFLTILAGIVTVAMTCLLARTIFPRRSDIFLVATFLAAINPYLIWDAQDAYMYSLLTAFAIASWILFLRVMKPNAARSTWAGYIVVSALALYLHYLAALILLAQGIAWLFLIARREVQRRTIVQWIGAQFAIVILFLPWFILALPLVASFKSDFLGASSLTEMLGRSLAAFSVGRVDSRLMPLMIDPTVGYPLSIVFLAIFLLGLLQGKADGQARIVLAISIIAPLTALLLFSTFRFPLFDERYVLYLIPLFILLVARGFSVARDGQGSRWMTVGAMCIVVIASGYSLNNYFHVPAFAKSPDWHGFMQQLFIDAKPGDLLLQNYPDPALPYYLQNRMPRVLLPRSSSATAAEVDADLNRLTNKYTRIWFQPAPHAEWDTEGLVATWLERHARLMNTYAFRGVQLDSYLPIAEALHQAEPIDAIFSNHIRLLAYDTDATTAHSGHSLPLTLYWQVLEPVERDTTVFVHLYDASGNLQSQQDNQPVHGTYPFSQWRVGETVVDSYILQIPPDARGGMYSLAVGMYDSQSQVRLLITSQTTLPSDRLMLKSLEVTP